MGETTGTTYPRFAAVNGLTTIVTLAIGAPIAIGVGVVWGIPTHAIVGLVVMAGLAGFGVTLGLHRLFTHRSFTTPRPIEWGLMVLGCVAGQAPPFSWVATHRKHHKHSDATDDPHSPHTCGGRQLGFIRGFWHAHMGWTRGGSGYDASAIRDLTRRPDLAWIDRYWYVWYGLGLLAPAAVGYLIGGTAYDALIGFLWGGLLRHAATEQSTCAVNSVCHVWGLRPYQTADQSRNSWLLGLLALGEGWHNNHHAFPYSARHGLHWWQPDTSWCVIWSMERLGLAWRVRRPVLPEHKLVEPEQPIAKAG